MPMMPTPLARRALLGAALLAAAALCHAEKADRDKPVNLESDRVTVDDINKVHVFEGRVTMSQGTLLIRGEVSTMLTTETAQRMIERQPRAELLTMPGVGHSPCSGISYSIQR